MHKNLSKLNFVLPMLYELETYWKKHFFPTYMNLRAMVANYFNNFIVDLLVLVSMSWEN